MNDGGPYYIETNPNLRHERVKSFMKLFLLTFQHFINESAIDKGTSRVFIVLIFITDFFTKLSYFL